MLLPKICTAATKKAQGGAKELRQQFSVLFTKLEPPATSIHILSQEYAGNECPGGVLVYISAHVLGWAGCY